MCEVLEVSKSGYYAIALRAFKKGANVQLLPEARRMNA
jgi:hypothetical protein